MNHYVYRITNKLIGRHYYGVRTSTGEPIDDLGVKYFSSSTDYDFMQEQKTCPESFKYKVLMTFSTRKSANDFECMLHHKFNVSINEKFYNRSEHTSSGWVSYGKVSVIDNHSKTFQVSITDKRYIDGDLKSVVIGKVNAINKKTGIKTTVSTDEYYNNIDLICNNTGKVPINDKDGNGRLVDKAEYDKGYFEHVSTGLVSVRDIQSGITRKVSQSEFDANKNFVGVNKDLVGGNANPNAKTIHIFNKQNNLMFVCIGNFEETCIRHKLPFTRLKSTIYSKKRLYSSKAGKSKATKNKTIQFQGWYAEIV